MTAGTAAPEAFLRVVIDAQLKDAGWVLTTVVRSGSKSRCRDGPKADYVFGDRHGRALAVLEAKRTTIDPLGAEKQARDHATQLGAPFVFLANGKEIWFWDHERLVAAARALNTSAAKAQAMAAGVSAEVFGAMVHNKYDFKPSHL